MEVDRCCIPNEHGVPATGELLLLPPRCQRRSKPRKEPNTALYVPDFHWYGKYLAHSLKQLKSPAVIYSIYQFRRWCLRLPIIGPGRREPFCGGTNNQRTTRTPVANFLDRERRPDLCYQQTNVKLLSPGAHAWDPRPGFCYRISLSWRV